MAPEASTDVHSTPDSWPFRLGTGFGVNRFEYHHFGDEIIADPLKHVRFLLVNLRPEYFRCGCRQTHSRSSRRRDLHIPIRLPSPWGRSSFLPTQPVANALALLQGMPATECSPVCSKPGLFQQPCRASLRSCRLVDAEGALAVALAAGLKLRAGYELPELADRNLMLPAGRVPRIGPGWRRTVQPPVLQPPRWLPCLQYR